MHILHVVGARPNFIKAAPVIRVLGSNAGVRQTLAHTGQHYDANMSAIFFQQLGLPEPDVNLEVNSGSHAQQTAEIMSRFEPVLLEYSPDLVLVYGDVNSTVAGALVCSKLLVPVGHVEAGLRSFDRSMPEEINRLLTDQIAELLFTPSPDADENLLREGILCAKIQRVGNVMIDSLVHLLPAAERSSILDQFHLEPQSYGIVTLHRPVNVDDPEALRPILTCLYEISQELPLIFPVHPRTRQRLQDCAGTHPYSRVSVIDPMSYLDFLHLQRQARLVITDSGGVQEETTYLGVPCLTLRTKTERPITVILGTNILVGTDTEKLRVEANRILAGDGKHGQIPPLWDGRAGERIAHAIL